MASIDSELTMEVANCGHPSPLLLNQAVGWQAVHPGRRSRPLGLGPDPEIMKVPLESGDRVLFYTDGLIEVGMSTMNG